MAPRRSSRPLLMDAADQRHDVVEDDQVDVSADSFGDQLIDLPLPLGSVQSAKLDVLGA